MIHHGLHSVGEVAALIAAGKTLLLAGDEALLTQLPPGRWIGGTIANFMCDAGGVENRTQIFVTDLSACVADAKIATYDEKTIPQISAHYAENGFTFLILPGFSAIHMTYAKDVMRYDGVFNAPLVGWVSGVAVSEIGKQQAKVFAGNSTPISDRAVALHVSLTPDLTARVDTINLFKRGTGATLAFYEEGFGTTGSCEIDGRPGSLAQYIMAHNIDTRLPLVADYSGAMVNVCVQAVDVAAGQVQFYAPVLRGVTYRFAEPVADYVSAFEQAVASHKLGTIAFSCNCILNYLYADLGGKKTGPMVGPVTFGEIAYILLNQTLVYLALEPKA